MTPPKVSVIVPMFNAGATVGATLDSLRAQTFGDWECVVVDDGSTDDGPAVARACAASDPRIRVLHQPNGGLSAARNAGIMASRAAWLHFLDADDWMLEDGLETLLELGNASRDGLACAATRWRSDQGNDLGYAFSPGNAAVTHEHLRSANRFQVHGAIVAKSALGAHRFDESLPALEDWDLWLRLTRHGAVWHGSSSEVAAYRLRPGSMSRDPVRMLGAAETVLSRVGCAQDPLIQQARTRLALEQVVVWVRSDSSSPIQSLVCRPRWLGGPGTPTLDPALVSEALRWRVPFLECLPPTAWGDEGHAPALARVSECVLERLIAWGRLDPAHHASVIAHLARLMSEPAHAAIWITNRCADARTVMLHGLGQNAAVLAPMLVAAGHSLLGRDDAVPAGEFVHLGGVCLRVVPLEVWAQADAHVVCPNGGDSLAAAVAAANHPNTRVIKWTDATTDISAKDLERLRRSWPRAGEKPLAELAA